MTRPPCWPDGQPCPNHCAAELYQRVVHNHVALSGPWDGWRLAGRDLVSPDGQRISPEHMRGLLWRLQAEARRDTARVRNETRNAGHRGMVTVLRIRNSDWHAEHLGGRAG